MSKRKSKSSAPAAPSAVPVQVKVKVAKPKKKQQPSRLLTPYQKMLADPFNAQCCPRPDYNDKPIIPWPEETVMDITTNADGDFMVTIQNCIKQVAFKHVITAGALVAGTTAVDVTNYTEIASAFGEYRPIVLCAHATYIGRADEAKGVMMVARSSTAPTTGDTFAMLCDEYAYQEDTVTDGGEVCGRLIEHKGQDFVAPSTAIYDTNPGQFLIIAGTNMPASTKCVRIRIQMHIEAIAGHSKLMSRGAVVSHTNVNELSASANLTGAKAMVSSGKGAYDKLVEHSNKLIHAANIAHGIIVAGKTAVENLVALF